MEKIPINSCSFSDLLTIPGIDNGLARVVLTLRQRHNGLSLSLLHRFIRPIIPAYWQAICQSFDFSTCTTDPRPSSTKSLTYSDNSDRCHQSVDDNDQFYPSSHVARSNSSRVSHNHARTGASLQREYPGSLSLVSPRNSDFRHARDTFADQSSRGHEDDVTRRSASSHSDYEADNLKERYRTDDRSSHAHETPPRCSRDDRSSNDDRRLSTRLWELLGMRCSDVDSSHHSKPHRSAEVPRRTSNSEHDPSPQYLRDKHSNGNSCRSASVRSSADYPRSAERASSRPVTLPRTITFDGSGSWHVFIAKFISFADECNWSSRQRKTQLSWCLVGKASEYYASLLEREPGLDLSGITRKLQAHFELPEISQMRFTYARQRTDETQTEWADRLLTLAMQAFPGLPEEHLQRQVILRFCQGSNSREAAQFAINSQPKTLDEALYRVRLFHCTQRTVYGKVRKDVRHLSVETDMIHPEVQVYKVGAVSNPLRPTSNPQRSTSIPLRPTSNPQRSTSIPQRPTSSSQRPSVSNLQCSPTSNTSSATDRLDRLESRMSTLENKVDSMHSLLLTISDSVITRSSPNRFRSSGRASPSRTNTCFKCGQIGHFRKDCPDIKKSGKTVSFVSDDEGNHYGSEEEAESRSE